MPEPAPAETYGKLLFVLDQLACEAGRRGDQRVDRAGPARRDRPRRAARPAVGRRGGGAAGGV